MRRFNCRTLVSVACVILSGLCTQSADAGLFDWGYGWPGYGYGYNSGYAAPAYTVGYGPVVPTTTYYGPLGMGWNTTVTNYAPAYVAAGGCNSGCNPCGSCSPCASCSPCGSPCSPCGGGCASGDCASGNCPGGNCGAGYTPPISDGPTPEPTEAMPRTPPAANPPAANPLPTYRNEPPLDDFNPVRPRENDTAVPSNIPRSTVPESTLPNAGKPNSSTIPDDAAPYRAPATPRGSTIPDRTPLNPGGSTIPVNPGANGSAPAGGTEDLFFSPNTGRSPAPLEPANPTNGADEGKLPGGALMIPAPLELDSTPSVTIHVPRRRILTGTTYRPATLARMSVAPRPVASEAARLAHK